MKNRELTSCCGADKIRISQIWCCSKCRRPINLFGKEYSLVDYSSARLRSTLEYDEEATIGDAPGRQDRDLDW